MPITSSTIIEDAAQRDGRRWIGERHVDDLELVYVFRYMVPAVFDAAAALAARAVQLAADLKASEIARNIDAIKADGSLASYSLLWSTAAENFAALRGAYQAATRTEAIFMGDFLSSLTDTQLRNAFGMTAGQVTTLRANKLAPAASAASTIRASTGA